ncbi:MAG: SAM-dependent DNA methyltransferase, partial [Rhizobiales bacterium]|nr:SAM-dependent DNA methyltransferase [Hyphomicrobiales bacterium]
FSAFRLDYASLDDFTHKTLHRPRRESIFRGPILLCSKVGNASGAERGRYSAAVSPRDVLYTQNFYGVSFAGADVKYAYALSGILNSCLTAFQFALGGPTWGLERPTVEPHDLLSLRIPDLTRIDPALFTALIEAEEAAAADPSNSASLKALDEAVFDVYDLDRDERTLARDSVERARYLVFENRSERAGLITPPDAAALRAASMRATGPCHLSPREG